MRKMMRKGGLRTKTLPGTQRMKVQVDKRQGDGDPGGVGE